MYINILIRLLGLNIHYQGQANSWCHAFFAYKNAKVMSTSRESGALSESHRVGRVTHLETQ